MIALDFLDLRPYSKNKMLTLNQVDAVLDRASQDDPDDIAAALGDLLDRHAAWTWTDDAPAEPQECLALVESSGAYWVVYRGASPDSAEAFGLRDKAEDRFDELKERLTEHMEEV